MPTPVVGSELAAHSSKTTVAGTSRPRSLCFHRTALARVNEPHVFLAGDNTIATGRLCFIAGGVRYFHTSADANILGDEARLVDRKTIHQSPPAGANQISL